MSSHTLHNITAADYHNDMASRSPLRRRGPDPGGPTWDPALVPQPGSLERLFPSPRPRAHEGSQHSVLLLNVQLMSSTGIIIPLLGRPLFKGSTSCYYCHNRPSPRLAAQPFARSKAIVFCLYKVICICHDHGAAPFCDSGSHWWRPLRRLVPQEKAHRQASAGEFSPLTFSRQQRHYWRSAPDWMGAPGRQTRPYRALHGPGVGFNTA